VCDAVLAGLGLRAPTANLAYRPIDLTPFARGRAAEVVLTRSDQAPERIAVVGELSAAEAARLGLLPPVAAAEIRLDRLAFAATGDHPLVKPSDFPAVQRDVNLVVDEAVPWGEVEAAIHAAAGASLDRCRLVQVWRDTDRLGAGRKSFVVALTLRSTAGTLSGDDAGRIVDAVVGECGRRVGAVLRGA